MRFASVASEAGQRCHPGLGGVTPDLSDERDLVQPGDLTLSLRARGMSLGQVANQSPDPGAELQCEVGCGGSHQLAHILHGHPVALTQTVGILLLAHFELCATASRRLSISAWTETEIASGAPITQPWL